MVLALCGPTCVGKTYAKEVLLRRRRKFKNLRWYTTKPLSSSEQVGRHLTEQQFLRNMKEGKLVLIHDRGDGYHYAYYKDDFLNDDTVFVGEFSTFAVFDLKRISPNTKVISIEVETTKSGINVLRKRLKQRNLSDTNIETVLSRVADELRTARENYAWFDTSVLVTPENEDNFHETVIHLADALTT